MGQSAPDRRGWASQNRPREGGKIKFPAIERAKIGNQSAKDSGEKDARQN